MPSPAERYAAARARSSSVVFAEFQAGFDFALDDFQVRACTALEAGRGVLVAAPTGSGKTVVGEFAVHLALARGQKAFYTAPIKALSNQKYADLSRRYGAANVGLLTGDSAINGHAPVVVMTTEVLRNMLYVGSPTLDGLAYVVMDEVHYLADRFRGPVWEEVIIHLPPHVTVVSLSATVSNAEEFGAWLGEVRGTVEVVVEEHRPVPLWQHMMVGRDLYDLFVERRGSNADRGSTAQVNPDLVAAIERYRRGTDRRGRLLDDGGPRGRRGTPRGGARALDEATYGGGTRRTKGRSRGGGGDRREQRYDGRGERRDATYAVRGGDARADAPVPGPVRRGPVASRAEVIDRLDREGLLPAITFIFSRAGCDAAVAQLLAWGTSLIPAEESDRIRRIVEERVSGLAPEDLDVLGYWDFLGGLTRGFAAHHAGMLPTFREIVEELFTAGRVKAVFATETLALGINMPARSVVLEKLVKFNGEAHVEVTPAEYTQLTGRAGRRGIDVEGHAVVLWNPKLDPIAVGGLASTRTYPLRSSFRPNPNMAANLVATVGRDRARSVLETSFAQFQADRAVVGLTRSIRRNEEALAGYAESMTCHLGDFGEYAAIRREISDVEKDAVRARTASRRAEVALALETLRAGDVVLLPEGRQAGRALVIAAAATRGRDPVVTALTEDARVRRIQPADLVEPLEPVGRVTIPKAFHARSAKDRRDLAATMRARISPDARPLPGSGPTEDDDVPAQPNRAVAASAVERRVAELRRRLRDHPCHRCPDREHHARWAERWWQLRRETDGLRRKVEGRTSSVARTFDRICDVLADLGYLDADGAAITPAGQRLRRIYSERDLLVAECLRQGHWAGLTPQELAAIVSALIHEPRREDVGSAFPQMPSGAVATAYEAMLRSWSDLDDRMTERHLPTTPAPDAGIAWMTHRWAAGARLETVLRDSDLAAGDFVRRCKQLVDLLDQIAVVAPQPALAATARKAVDAVMRGVVAADRLD
jgi:ATP-dependent RNA helicase HelY